MLRSKGLATRSTCSGTSRARHQRRSCCRCAVACSFGARLWRGGSHRACHALWIGWVLWFGVIESGITTNYLLLPVTFMLIAIACDRCLSPIVIEGEEYPPPQNYVTPRWSRVWSVVVAGWLPWLRSMASSRSGRSASHDSRRRHRRDSRRASAERSHRLHRRARLPDAGRPHRSLARARRLRSRTLSGAAGRWTASGVYTGVPAAFRPGDLFSPNADGTLPDRVIVVDIFKEYPIGNSRSWLPKAIEEDGLAGDAHCSKPRKCASCRFRPKNRWPAFAKATAG